MAARLALVVLLLAGGCAADDGPAPAPRGRPRIELHTYGLDNARFGASSDTVTTMLRARLGAPDDDTGWTACRGTRVRSMRWRRLTVHMSDGAFVGYALTESGDPRPIDARTDSGIGLGDSPAEPAEGYDLELTPSGRVSSISAGAPPCEG